MTRRTGRGRVTSKTRRTGSGLVVPGHVIDEVERQIAMGALTRIRERACDDPRCVEDWHREELCVMCTAESGFPRYHILRAGETPAGE